MGQEGQGHAGPPAPLGPPTYRIGEWFQQAWKLFKGRILELVALILILMVPSAIIGTITTLLRLAFTGEYG